MSDRVRGALFATLGDIEGLTVLDAFAGTGALGLEAASRGAEQIVLLENDTAAQRTIQANIAGLGVASKVSLVRTSCSVWSDAHNQETFDLVMADPPFDNLQRSTIAKLAKHVTEGGLLVLNWPTADELPQMDAMELVAEKSYGNTRLAFYRG